MKKAGILILTLLVMPLLAGIYGAIHDQVSFTISPEYFTKFKYLQFGFEPTRFGGDRQTVAAIGFLATWWTGILIGIGHGFTGLIHRDHRIMVREIIKGTTVTILIAALTGVTGLLYGIFFLAKTDPGWWLPHNLADRAGFISVGSMHNFSYIGGALGLIAGVAFQVRQKKRGG